VLEQHSERHRLVREALELCDLDERDDVYLCAELHALGMPQGEPARRTANWVTRLHAYERFWGESGRAPRENSRDKSTLPDVERRLGEWARYQRRFEPDLTAFQRARLDVSPAFEWDPWASNWERQLYRCRQQLAVLGSLPTLNGADPAEFRLARWLARALKQMQYGLLSEEREVSLTRLLKRSRRTGATIAGGAWRPHARNAESSTYTA